MAKRKAITKKTRFEVFKRDLFKCQYCGAEAPDVVLNVDHIHPVSKGGDNSITNLVTACFGCNSGKSDVQLDDDSAVKKQRNQIEELELRRQQLEMMVNWRRGLSEIDELSIDAISNLFTDLTGAKPGESDTKLFAKLIKKHPINDVLDCIEEGADIYLKFDGNGVVESSVDQLIKRLPGICKNLGLSDYQKRSLYIWGICRNRFYVGYSDNPQYQQVIKDCERVGVPIGDIESSAKQSVNYEDFISHLIRATVDADREQASNQQEARVNAES